VTKQELTAIMRDLNVRAGEAVVRTLEQGSPGIIARFGIESDLVKILHIPLRPSRATAGRSFVTLHIRGTTARFRACSDATCASRTR
jgi:hypothetical protein